MAHEQGFSPFELPSTPSIPERLIDIREHGAVADGSTVNTHAIARAIATCAEAGGGTVLVPPGIWLTGPIHLKSRIELRLADDAELRFSQDFEQYLPVVYMQRGGIRCYNYSPLIYARNCHDVALTGKGVLNGQGPCWWPWKKAQPGMIQMLRMVADRVPVEQRVFGTPESGVRTEFLQFLDCENVWIDGPTFIDSPSWTVHPVGCRNVIVRNVAVRNPPTAPNTDGINADACRNVLIEHCHVDTGDDGICVKSGWNEDGWDAGLPCQDVVIRHCTVLSAHGGFVVGSEVSGGISNVHVHDCQYTGTDIGVRIKTKPGRGGYIRGVLAERLKMRRIHAEAILISTQYRGNPHDQAPLDLSLPITQINGITIRDIECDSAGRSILLQGIAGHPIGRVSLSDIQIVAAKPALVEHVAHLEAARLDIRALREERQHP